MGKPARRKSWRAGDDSDRARRDDSTKARDKPSGEDEQERSDREQARYKSSCKNDQNSAGMSGDSLGQDSYRGQNPLISGARGKGFGRGRTRAGAGRKPHGSGWNISHRAEMDETRAETTPGFTERGSNRGGLGERHVETGREDRSFGAWKRATQRRTSSTAYKRTFPLAQVVEIENPRDVIWRLVSSLSEFEDFINLDSLPTEQVIKVLKILSKVSSCHADQGENVIKILQIVCSSKLINTYMGFIIQDLQNPDLPEETVTEVLEAILHVLSTVCLKLPSSASRFVLPVTVLTSQPWIMDHVRKSSKPNLEKDLKELLAMTENCMKMVSNASQVKEGSRVRHGPNKDDESPPEDFISLSIFPQERDMDWFEKPFLRANKAKGAFRDAAHYLDVQFRLLREDYIRPLRKGLREYKKKKEKGDKLRKITDLRVYQGVQIVGAECSTSLEHRLHFDVTGLENVRWRSSKRFTFGSLLCLSLDDFETIYFATVTEREPEDLQKGIVQVRFESGLEDIMDSRSNDVFTMAETTGAFFEAYRYVLEGLQEFGKNLQSLPMARYLVDCNKQMKPPAYLLKEPMPTMDLSSILRRENERSSRPALNDPTQVTVINPKTWPAVEDTVLNEPQLEAVKTALSKEMAIIQGPPGTGKTFVGLKVAKILLDNIEAWTAFLTRPKPILVVCYTNHALDQFLEGILTFCEDGIVRVGSRSKSSSLERFNLKKIRDLTRRNHSTNLSIIKGIKDCKRELRTLHAMIESVSSALEKSTYEILKEGVLKQYMMKDHLESLTSVSILDETGKSINMMAHWLGLSPLLVEEADDIKEKNVDPSTVSDLPYPVRAQLYRLWLRRVRHRLQGKIKDAEVKRRYREHQMYKEDLLQCDHEVLPDQQLRPVMNTGLYSAITRKSSTQKSRKQTFFVRSWLGLSGDASDAHLLQEILYPGVASPDDGKRVEPDEEEMEGDAADIKHHRQLDDDEAIFDEDRTSSKPEAFTIQRGVQENSSQDLGACEKDKSGNSRSMEPWSVPKLQRRKEQHRVTRLLKTYKPMTSEEAVSIKNLWDPAFSVEDRVRLYLSWVRAYQDELRESMKSEAKSYAQEAKRLQELKFSEDLELLEKAKVIGMTTTAAGRYRRVLESVGCPIIIIEEAAEVLEGHVVTTFHKQCQHLILIGDHQQLRPTPTVYELARRYNLDLSLFERLVKNGLPHATLAVQHRMRPEVARLVRHVYPHLQDHESVLGRPHVRGMKHDVFLFHHEASEGEHEGFSSKSNQHEAEMCVGLCRYLMLQDYPAHDFSILTPYSGQLLLLQDLIQKEKKFFEGVRVTTVDNYQGEESDVIILSLVRSNPEGSVGFVGIDNRVCVALSRARNGFFAFGNFKLLSEKSDLWRKVVQTAKEHDQYGESLELFCENHPETVITVSCLKDFDQAPEGGCRLPCRTRLEPCGHVCTLLCHGYDRDHSQYRCMKECRRKICEDGHPCPKPCHQPCGPCQYSVQKTLPICGHTETMPCHTNPLTWTCGQPCPLVLPCGHQCSRKCGQCRRRGTRITECPVQAQKKWLTYGHLVTSPCYTPPGHLPCRKPCQAILVCGHRCAGSCGQCWSGRVHLACTAACPKALQACSHSCSSPCGVECLPCRQFCPEKCSHGVCQHPCGMPCVPCTEPCPWQCSHRPCTSLCYEPCRPCPEPCDKELKCRHRCRGLCGEACVCFVCESQGFVDLAKDGKEAGKKVDKDTLLFKIWFCGHVFRVDDLDEYVRKKLETLPLNSPLTCPGCLNKPTFFFSHNTWRYSGLLLKRHEKQQEIKREILQKNSVPEDWWNNMKSSLDLLPEHVKDAFTAVPTRRTWDINLTSALTLQARLAYVIIKLSEHEVPDLKEDTQVLQNILHCRMEAVSEQQRRQLTTETKRLVYKHLLSQEKDHMDTDTDLYLAQLRHRVEEYYEQKEKNKDTAAEQTSEETTEAHTLRVFHRIQNLIKTCQEAVGDVSQSQFPERDLDRIFKACYGTIGRTADQLLPVLNASPEMTLVQIVGPQAAKTKTVTRSLELLRRLSRYNSLRQANTSIPPRHTSQPTGSTRSPSFRGPYRLPKDNTPHSKPHNRWKTLSYAEVQEGKERHESSKTSRPTLAMTQGISSAVTESALNEVPVEIPLSFPTAADARPATPRSSTAADGRPATPLGSPTAADGRPATPLGSPTAADASLPTPLSSPTAADARPATPLSSPTAADASPATPRSSTVADASLPTPYTSPTAADARPATPLGSPTAADASPATPCSSTTADASLPTPYSSPTAADASLASPLGSPTAADARPATPLSSPTAADVRPATPLGSPTAADARPATPLSSPTAADASPATPRSSTAADASPATPYSSPTAANPD